MAVAEATRHHLLEAAAEVFAERGFKAATVRQICNRAGLNLSSVNYYFRDKEQLYIETVQHAAELLCVRVSAEEWPPGMPAAAKLRAFVEMFLSRMLLDQGPAWAVQLIMREIFQPTPACTLFVEQFTRPNFKALLAILDELVPPETPQVRRHQLAFSIVGQCLHYRLARPIATLLVGQEEFARYTVADLAEHITRFSLGGLQAFGAEVPR